MAHEKGNAREVLVVRRLDEESLGGEVAAPGEEFTRKPSPGELVPFGI